MLGKRSVLKWKRLASLNVYNGRNQSGKGGLMVSVFLNVGCESRRTVWQHEAECLSHRVEMYPDVSNGPGHSTFMVDGENSGLLTRKARRMKA